MLPSCGYFKNILCPFFKVGLCDRPHCHYKHVKTEVNERQAFTSVIEENESLLDTDPKANLLQLLSSRADSEITAVETLKSATYIPTPVVRCAVKPSGILKDTRTIEKPSTSSVPEYRPTPISRLKDYNVSHIKRERSEYSPDHPETGRKKKKCEEYDPTEVRAVSRKRVSFAIADEVVEIEEVLPDVIDVESSEEEDDGDIVDAPKFSDDDLDDDLIHDFPQKYEEIKTLKISSDKPECDLNSNTDKIDEFSLVDKIIVDSKKNEQLLNCLNRPLKKLKTDVSSSKSTVGTRSSGKETKLTDDSFILQLDCEGIVNSDKVNSLKKSIESEASKIFDNLLLGNNKELETKLSDNKELETKLSDNKELESKLSDDKELESKSSEAVTEKIETKKSHSSKHYETKKSSSSKSKSDKERSSSAHKLVIKLGNSKNKKIGSKEEKHSKHSSSSETSSKSKHDKVPSEKKNSDKSDKTAKKGSEETKIQDGMVSSSDTVKKEKSSKSSDTVKKEKSSKSSEAVTNSNKSEKTKDNKMSHKKHKKTKEKTNDADAASRTESTKIKSPKKDKKEAKDNESDCTIGDSELLTVSSDSDRDEEECWRIYNESYPNYVDSNTPTPKPVKATSSTQKEELVFLGKKRLAHHGAEALRKPKPKAVQPEAKKLNPVQVMHNRYAQLQAMYARQDEERSRSINGKPANQRKIVMNMPNHSLIEAVTQKNQYLAMTSKQREITSGKPVTTGEVLLKGTKRIAHVPLVALKPRPIIPTEFGSKVPTNLRQKFLNTFIDECLKFCQTEEEAYETALDEEKRAYDRSTSKAIYMNVASNAVSRLRRRAEDGPLPESSSSSDVSSTSAIKAPSNTISHESILAGPRASKTSFSIERKKPKNVDIDIKGTALYKYLLSYALSADQLIENGFPLMHPTELGRAVIGGVRKQTLCNDAFKRTCCRCQKIYYVNTEGDYVKDEECDFHWGHLWKRRIAGSIESRYSCCQGDSESDGCCVSAGHVYEGSETHALRGFVKTLPKTPPPDKYYGIYALDCEMCYTTAGIELTRITVIGPDMKPVFESFVKPQNKVLDYNTRFSGITEEDLVNVRTSIRDVQAVLLCIFNERTILIGHSLESDFKALKLFHKTVVDTSVVFPHKMGLPYKRALKTLMAEKLNKIIQNNVGGHDSNEDAVACMELMIWKIKEDLKSGR